MVLRGIGLEGKDEGWDGVFMICDPLCFDASMVCLMGIIVNPLNECQCSGTYLLSY